MPRFKVRCYQRGEWDGHEPRDVEAQKEQEAAEQVCGEALVEGRVTLGTLRAEVWPASSPGEKKLFRVQG